MKLFKLGLLVFTYTMLIALPIQAADSEPEQDTNKDLIMEEVTVTASKREGTLKDFPGNISVMDNIFMETRGVNDLGNLMRYTPNIYIKNTSSGSSIVCRGISTIDTSLFSPMGLYVDDVPYPMGYMTNQNLFDVERVEVLRGPQATLYGRNSESGVTNIVLKEPDNEQHNKVLLETGTYRTARLGFASSGPITEDLLFYRIALQGYTTNGYNENILDGDEDVTGEKTFDGRGTLRWTPTRDWDIFLNIDGANRDKGISALRYTDGPNATDRYKVTSNENDKAYEHELGQSAKIKHSWSNVELLSITSHRTFDREHHLDSDRTATALGYSDLDTEMDSWNQEFRLISTDKSALSWLLGLNGRYEAIDAGIDMTHVLPALTSTRSGDSEDVGYAGFGQATYEIVQGLRLTGGLRLDVSHNNGKQTYTPNTGAVSYTKDVDATEWLPMLSLAYDVNPHITAYSTVSKGFLAGGFNFYSATDEDSFAYDAEHVTNYEMGIKTNWLDNTLSFNTTIFYMDITDKQVREEVPGGATGVWKFTNAAETHTAGIELDGRYRPIPELQFIAGFGYADSVVDNWETEVGGTPVDYSGNKVPWAPEFTYNLGVEYTHKSGFFANADLLGTGEQYFDAANELKEDGYQTINLRTGYQTDNIELSVWCSNLFDEAYAVKQVSTAAGYTLQEDGAPRTFGFTINWRF
ncbi:TonB-dependent receptor [Pseudodesulfovibrio sediminis]|uniref:TonB-dependent receptor n=1 Tax=Pseudodesulfovibrio sediminis TaxID=2810563 RepID=A0ABN6ERD1_9BACT|nr:TonB-dependent receptor [Pseudodesulfovibrio sediminis]BCS87624.1 TonB-dependent receptor [Pseudodesulfovibrio sediminis]